MEMSLTLAACVLILVSGVPGLFSRRRSAWGQMTATVLVLAGSLIGLTGSFAVLVTRHVFLASLPGIWPGAPFQLKMDSLSAFFSVLIFLMAAVGSIYGHGYWRQREHSTTGQKLRLHYGVMLAAMVVVTLADDALAFLLAWEVMALTSFFLIATEDGQPECRQAAWVYFVATHLSTLALFAMFALMHEASGKFLLSAIPVTTGAGLKMAIFLLALLGFGLKAGMMPLHFWLPSAHANAPSHISALLSGVLLKVGIYGLLRVLTLMPDPPAAWGVLILTLGAISAVLGVAFALGQHDIKRLLAFHSVENVGIILMGLGVAMIGIAVHHPVWVILGIAGCLLHVWNHGLFKSLLFLSAGSIVRSTGTRNIDSLGGLARRMPWTAGLFMLGAIAICGLPPLNGFISELLVYLGLLRPAAGHGSGSWVAVASGAVVLAMVGALAVACFVKVLGGVFLGSGRSTAATEASEAPLSMRGAMAVLAGLCVAIGVAPVVVLVPLESAATVWMGNEAAGSQLAVLFPWTMLTAISMGLAVTILIAVTVWQIIVRADASPRRATWACGYTKSNARMQYTASSFVQILLELLRWVLRPITHGAGPKQLFAESVDRHTDVPDFITDRMASKYWQIFKQRLIPLRRIQQGSVQEYLLYMLLAVFIMLALLIPFGQISAHLLGR